MKLTAVALQGFFVCLYLPLVISFLYCYKLPGEFLLFNCSLYSIYSKMVPWSSLFLTHYQKKEKSFKIIISRDRCSTGGWADAQDSRMKAAQQIMALKQKQKEWVLSGWALQEFKGQCWSSRLYLSWAPWGAADSLISATGCTC